MELLAQTQPPGLTEALTAAAGSVPGLVVVVILVMFFLKHLATLEKRHEERDSNAREFTKQQTESLQATVEDCKLVIRDNTQAMRENSAALSRVTNGR